MDTGKIISLLVPTRLEPFTLIEFPGILESPEHLSNHLEARNILQVPVSAATNSRSGCFKQGAAGFLLVRQGERKARPVWDHLGL